MSLAISSMTVLDMKRMPSLHASRRTCVQRENMANPAKLVKVIGEYKRGQLHSGSKQGPVVGSRAQAIAIALSEAKKGKK